MKIRKPKTQRNKWSHRGDEMCQERKDKSEENIKDQRERTEQRKDEGDNKKRMQGLTRNKLLVICDIF